MWLAQILLVLVSLAGLWGIITGGNIIRGTFSTPYANAGVPSTGTAAVQTITIGGTPTGGTFKLALDGFSTAAISWSATNGTLVSNIDAALEALVGIGVGGVVTAVGTMTAGIGTITLTFSPNKPFSTLTVADNSMTGTLPTIAVATTTPGVLPTGGGSVPKGALLIDSTNALLYENTGTDFVPIWTKVGTQT